MCRDRKTKPRVLLITGRPGVGKTTVIRRVAEQLETRELRGFYTEEIREGGERRGFRFVGFDGSTGVIAHVDFTKSRRVGKYGVDVNAVDDAAALLRPDPAAHVYLVDEIGKMECQSERFVASMRALLSAGAPVVATVAARGTGFIAEIKRSPDCELWEVSHANRDELPSRICAWIAAAQIPSRPTRPSSRPSRPM
jgi:nucleoside-triphosphatase